jgi:HSP20 family protein
MNKNLTTTNKRDLSPWSVFRDDLWDVFDRFSKEFDMPTMASLDHITPKIEVKDLGKTYQVCAEVPGMDEKDISVTLRENNLVIEGERKSETKNEDKKSGRYHSEISYGRFYRSIPLSDDIDAENVNASYKNGILTVELAKNPERAQKERKIQIGSGKKETTQETQKH